MKFKDMINRRYVGVLLIQSSWLPLCFSKKQNICEEYTSMRV